MELRTLHPQPARDAACGVMSVRYMENIEDHVLDGEQGRIQIQVACEQGLYLRPADMVVMSLSAAFVRARFQESSRHTPKLRDRYSSADPFLRRAGNTLLSGFRVHRPPTSGYLEALAGTIADHLGRYYAHGVPTPGNGLSPHRLQRVCALIDERMAEQLHVEDLAASICMSPFHFARMFKKSIGEAPHEYLTRVRMEEAKRLLVETNEPLSSIAVRVGYRTQAHFTGVFHERTGSTPRGYRLRRRS